MITVNIFTIILFGFKAEEFFATEYSWFPSEGLQPSRFIQQLIYGPRSVPVFLEVPDKWSYAPCMHAEPACNHWRPGVSFLLCPCVTRMNAGSLVRVCSRAKNPLNWGLASSMIILVAPFASVCHKSCTSRISQTGLWQVKISLFQ